MLTAFLDELGDTVDVSQLMSPQLKSPPNMMVELGLLSVLLTNSDSDLSNSSSCCVWEVGGR